MAAWKLSSCDNLALIEVLNPSEILSLFVRLRDRVFATQINAQLSESIFHYLKNAA